MQRNNDINLLGNKNLSYKIIVGIMLGMSLLVTLLIFVFSYSFQLLETELMEKLNHAELEHVTEQLLLNPDYPLPRTANLKIFTAGESVDHLPEYLRKLPAGFKGEIKPQDRDFFVLVSRVQDQLIYVVNDISDFERNEDKFSLIIILSWFTLIALIFLLSYLLSRNLLQPISDFADEIDGLAPEQRGTRLSGRFHGLEIEKIARAVDDYFNKLDEYVERQHSFAAMASHELRTPLTVVQTSAELIGSRTQDPDIVSQCQKISRSCSSMNDMILALLSITRDLPAEKQEKAQVSLRKLVQDVLNTLQQQLDLNRIEVVLLIDEHAEFECNAPLLSVVVNNLLANAIKHCPQGLIQITYADQRLEILDNGEGLGTENVDRLFLKGVGGGKNSGYGLGLYITRLICENQNWQLELQHANPGTLARVTLS